MPQSKSNIMLMYERISSCNTVVVGTRHFSMIVISAMCPNEASYSLQPSWLPYNTSRNFMVQTTVDW